ncbi:unnamed protein product [Paramecium pentaurelia]|uniref:Serine/threonine-protein phosphatase n=1 Tax=Paramecium pentaurelia TaxID=43138 RepID=A0A8S1VVD0_9CILI|nr:unnamed protein product [Paramecium pentaurelia]
MDFLQDPKGDRQVNTIPTPPHRPLSEELLFIDDKPNWKLLKEHLFKEGRITKNQLLRIVDMCNYHLKNEGNVIYVDDPLTLVGDIHGQYYDLMKILELGGDPEQGKYIYYPTRVFLLRGNHECKQLTSYFNFRDECLYKYDQEVYEAIMASFDNMPLVALINNKFLCLHGGISPDLKSLADVERIDRFREPPKAGLFCDILWADPVENEELYDEIHYRGNDTRGCSWFFGEKAVQPFLDNNKFICLIRAHEAQLEGYRLYKYNEKIKEFPQVLTIFSAPNYCDVYNNKAAILKFENCTLNISQFGYSQHPYLLPHFLDIFSWSIPFVTEKVTEMLNYVLQPRPGEKIEDSDKEIQNAKVISNQQTLGQPSSNNRPLGKLQQMTQKQIDITKSKISFVSKMMKMQTVLRQERENIIKLKGLCPDKRIPRGVLLQGAEGIKDALEHFNTTRAADRINEKWPETK